MSGLDGLVTRSEARLIGESWAVFSPCGTWRYLLVRRWTDGPAMRFVMCNPSTADETDDDPTVARCRKRAALGGYGALVVANIFALRSSDPRALESHPDPVGPANDEMLYAPPGEVGEIGITVAAWGTWGRLGGRGATVAGELAARGPLFCLGVTKEGHPRHPLYLPEEAALEPFPAAGERAGASADTSDAGAGSEGSAPGG